MHKLFRHIFTKWPPAAILVFPICSKIDRVLPPQVINGPSMAVSIINLIRALVSQLRETQAFSSYFHKMAVGSHFGFPIFSKIDRVLPL